MEPITALLQRVFTPSQQRKLRIQEALRRWPDLVGPEIAGATHVESFRNDTLFVSTRSAVWTQELTLLKPRILDKLNEVIGEQALHDIVFRPGQSHGSKRKSTGGGAKKPKQSRSATPKLTRADRDWLDSFAAGVHDERLRDTLKQCALRTLELRKQRRMQKWRECDACRYQNPPGTHVCRRCGRRLALGGKGAPRHGRRSGTS